MLSDIRDKMLQVGRLEPGAGRRLYMTSVLPFFLYQFCPGPSLRETAPFPSWLSELIRKMEEPENYIEGLPRLLSLASLSQEYLNQSFRRFLHMSPTEFINMRRMDYAAGLLLENRLEVIDICQECGIHNLSYFYRVFRKQYGCFLQGIYPDEPGENRMNSYYRLYRPITAAPLRNDGTYTEIPPCDALKPYIKCFWSSEGPADGAGTKGELIIPDTCMDIIFEINHTRNRIENRFVGINNKAFLTAGGMKGTDRRSVSRHPFLCMDRRPVFPGFHGWGAKQCLRCRTAF